MTTTFRSRSEGLHHAVSLGNIDVPSQPVFNYASRNYESEDENMGRLKCRQQALHRMRPPIYSKEDIIDQYCLTDRQLNNSIEAPRRDRFFGCWSTRSQQSFLGVCVGRRAPSDENLQDYAPINRHPRIQKPLSYDDDADTTYFRRKPTSFLTSSDGKRHTWMTASDDNSIQIESSRFSKTFAENNGGAHSHKNSFLSQSTEQITGYRCPAHINMPPSNQSSVNYNQQELAPRTKHVSFARSLTLASFDDAISTRQNRMLNVRSQERLIGGKKPTLTITQQPPQQISMIKIPILEKPILQQTFSQPHLGLQFNQQPSNDSINIEKQKRNVMKTQATQTEACSGRKLSNSQALSLSPKTIHRVKMVSQGAQTNGMAEKRFIKSYSEMGGTKMSDADCQYEDTMDCDHEILHRTQSEDSPKSPIDMSYIKPSSGYMLTTAEIHSRTPSRQSQLESCRSSKTSCEIFPTEPFNFIHSNSSTQRPFEPNFAKSYNDDNAQNFFHNSRLSTQILQNEPILIGRNELEQMRISRGVNAYEFESHSLPRRACIHHKPEEYHTHSLPRQEHRDHHHHYLLEHTPDMRVSTSISNLEQVTPDATRHFPGHNDAYVNASVVADTYSLSRRSSMQQQQVPSVSINLSQLQMRPQHFYQHHHSKFQQVPPSEELCSTCSSESMTESETDVGEEESEQEIDAHNDEEKEIFIDFKPHVSPVTDKNITATKKKKKLIKTMSEGEILMENHEKHKQKLASASEEDLQEHEDYAETFEYSDTPIRDEDIFKTDRYLKASGTLPALNRYNRETFRKRSVSLEETEIVKKSSTPASPTDGKSIASNDEMTRDASDGIWNESQATVVYPRAGSPQEENNSHLLPSLSKRKHLQHQQRSSLDVEALEVEDIADQPLPPLPPIVQPQANVQKLDEMLTPQNALANKMSMPSNTTPTGVVKPTPSIAVTHTQSIDKEEKALINMSQRAKQASPSKRRDLKKNMQHKPKLSMERVNRPPDSTENLKNTIESKASRVDNKIDVSEGSTTEDYVTCTENSKRQPHVHGQGIRFALPSKSTIFTASHLPGTTQNSQNIVDGSSFESASSFHSLARIEAICEDIPAAEDKPNISPTHSEISTSSGSYRMPPTIKASSPCRTTLPKALPVLIKKNNKKHSLSDDERSEKFQSSSHDENEYKTLRMRKSRDYSEEERRKKKGNFKLEFEKDTIKTPVASQFVKPLSTKKISPEDKNALNTLDGASPSKQKPRFRQKTRKSPRNRTSNTGDQDLTTRRPSKSTILNKNAEKPSVVATPIPQQQLPTNKVSPSKFPKTTCTVSSPSKQTTKKITLHTQRLKAISTESLRSVSPGSDSVFYSEADILEHQIHCHHCGKEVDVGIGAGGSEDSVTINEDGPDIVQPPEGFADSPNGLIKNPIVLKHYKRFRSEDRRHKKGSNGRAKSEERGNDEVNESKIRGTGSSPCVAPAHDLQDSEKGIYHGLYTQDSWICIADKDFWRKNDILAEAKLYDTSERRGSTESEKDFRKKYQAITHRLVHRKSCVEMYRRQSSNSFDTDKHVVVQRFSGEFGFRIHGSKPVVVSAIEKNTAAETSGLEVGDIVLSVNGISVVDKSHSEVVKIAHAGSDILELQVARTINALSPVNDSSSQSLYSGFLWRKSGSNDNIKWIRRWFCLRSDQCLYYFKNETDIQPLGIILLTNHSVFHLSLEKSNRPFSFIIECFDSRNQVLAADTQETANGWVAILSHAAEQKDPWLEMSTRTLKLSPSAINRPDCVGYLMKFGLRWKSWTKRYCILKDACLYFYYDANSECAFGMVYLQGYRVQPFATSGKKYAFELVPSEPKFRNFYFHTETEMDKKRWIAALEYSIDRWMKAP